MTFTVKNTKEDVLKIYDNCLDFIKTNFPEYYDVVKTYRFSFGKKKGAYGTCHYRTKEIKIHMYLSGVVEPSKVKDTILHEMAHAIDKGVNGYSSGHGNPWKRICRQIGCDPTCSSSDGADIVKPSKFVMVVDTEDGYEYVQPVHRVTKKKPLNTKLQFAYLKKRKSETMGKLMVVTFEDFKNNQKDSDQN